MAVLSNLEQIIFFVAQSWWVTFTRPSGWVPSEAYTIWFPFWRSGTGISEHMHANINKYLSKVSM